MNKLLFIVILFFCSSTVMAKKLTLQTKKEIEHLQEFIVNSNCKFFRNNTWYETSEAINHINKKYNCALDEGVIKTGDDFINYTATKSSFSGEKYMVKCGNEEEIESSKWLRIQLKNFRKTNTATPMLIIDDFIR